MIRGGVNFYRRFAAVFMAWIVISALAPVSFATNPARHFGVWDTPASDPSFSNGNDTTAWLHNKARFLVMSPWPDSFSWGIYRHSDDQDMNDSYLTTDVEYYVNITIVDFTGWDDVERVRIYFWYDFGNDSKYYNYSASNSTYPGAQYGNYHFILEYNNGTSDPNRCPSCEGEGKVVWKIWDCTNESEVTFNGGYDRVAQDSELPSEVTNNEEYDTGDAHHLWFNFTPHAQFHRAGGDKNGLTRPVGPAADPLDPSTWWYQDYLWMLNDNGSWNYAVSAVDKSTYDRARPLGEFGMYAHTSISVNDTTVYGSGNPGSTITTTYFNITASINFEGNISVTLEDDLYRTDWAAGIEWINSDNVSINGTELDKYAPGQPLECGSNTTIGGNKTFDDITTPPGHPENSTKVIVSFHNATEARGPERFNNLSWEGNHFEINVPSGILGGTYITPIVFTAEQWEWPEYEVYVSS